MIAISDGLGENKNLFHIRPSLGSRELFMFASNERSIEDRNINKIAVLTEETMMFQF